MCTIACAFPVNELSDRATTVAGVHAYDDLRHHELASNGVELLVWEAAWRSHKDRGLPFDATRDAQKPLLAFVIRAVAPACDFDVACKADLFGHIFSVAMKRVNFTECGIRYKSNTTLQNEWGWDGPVIMINKNTTTQISRAGCLHICGSGADYYPWKEASGTITTWILPVVGTLLQAPFESNATRRTLLAITRWCGSPIASLSYVLWNIKVSAKAAVMVDMAVKYDETPKLESDFGSMRDSMYLLLAMNQYTLKDEVVASSKEAEDLLRIVLFSKDLILTDTTKPLREVRRILAGELRVMRRRGVVAVFISIMWFLFAFALSIQAAFGDLGENTTAHDLALGCLLAWFPILIMSSIVDRNPIAAEAIRIKLNTLVDHVRHALSETQTRENFINSFGTGPNKDLRDKVESLATLSAGTKMKDFFEEFAGQARVRWHYGAAHPILSDIENCYIAKKGRNWLADEAEARASLVTGASNDEGLVWFDIRECWQIMSAVIIVGASCGGAFVLSYFTPTVGLGCRSGGYTVFFAISFGLLIVEMTVWLWLSPHKMEWPIVTTVRECFNSSPALNRWGKNASGKWVATKSFILQFFDHVWEIGMTPFNRDSHLGSQREHLTETVNTRIINTGTTNTTTSLETIAARRCIQKRWELFFFRPVETGNAIWLVYIVLAQTFGLYKTCACVTSTWGGGGGYLDFDVQDTANSRWVLVYWTTATVLTGFVMALSMFYITVEWCQQSFLSTEDYSEAMKGLQLTRLYRHYTYFARRFARSITGHTLNRLEKLALLMRLINAPQETLYWEKDERKSSVASSPTGQIPLVPPRNSTSPQIELPKIDFRLFDSPVREATALAYSSFPPTITTNYADSGSFLQPPMHQMYSTQSTGDSIASSLQFPTEAYRARDSFSSDEHRNSGDDLITYIPPAGEQTLSSSLQVPKVQPRQGYRRANSDPRRPSFDFPQLTQNVSNIDMADRDLEKGTP